MKCWKYSFDEIYICVHHTGVIIVIIIFKNKQTKEKCLQKVQHHLSDEYKNIFFSQIQKIW